MRYLKIVLTCIAIGGVSSSPIEDENKPYEFGFTIDGQQHRHEKKDINGIIQGEFGFITADGRYHVTTYATDVNGSFKILSMRSFKVSGPLDGSADYTLSSQPLTDVKQLQLMGHNTKAKIDTKPHQTITTPAPQKTCTGCRVPVPATVMGQYPQENSTNGEGDGHGHGKPYPISSTKQNNMAISSQKPIELIQDIVKPTEEPQILTTLTPVTTTLTNKRACADCSYVSPTVKSTSKPIANQRFSSPLQIEENKVPENTRPDSMKKQEIFKNNYTPNEPNAEDNYDLDRNVDIDTKSQVDSSRNNIPINQPSIFLQPASYHPQTFNSGLGDGKIKTQNDNQSINLNSNSSPLNKQNNAFPTLFPAKLDHITNIDDVVNEQSTPTKFDQITTTGHVANEQNVPEIQQKSKSDFTSSHPTNPGLQNINPQNHISENLEVPKLDTQTLPLNRGSQDISMQNRGSQNLGTPSQNTAQNQGTLSQNTAQNIRTPSQNTAQNQGTPSQNTAQNLGTPSQNTAQNQGTLSQNTAQNIRTPSQNTAQNLGTPSQNTAQNLQTPSQNFGTPSQNTAQNLGTPSQNTAQNQGTPSQNTAQNLVRQNPNEVITTGIENHDSGNFNQNFQKPPSATSNVTPTNAIPNISSSSSHQRAPTQTHTALEDIEVTRDYIKVPNNPPIKIVDKFPGSVDGLPDGITEEDISNLLYKFNYTIGFYGHYEKGWRNGTKVGGYFLNGMDGISQAVTYVADELGYRPKFKLINLGLDSSHDGKEGTEKKFGLTSFEFVWYPLK